MSDSNNPKRLKTILSVFRKDVESLRDESTNPNPSFDPADPILNDHNQPAHPQPQKEIDESQRVENDQEFDINSIVHDPGVRRQICSYSIKRHDDVRLAYILKGPCQPKLAVYPAHLDGDQNRRFSESWFTKFSWLEYSVKEDKAYCFPCFLFDQNKSQKSFTTEGFRNWKRVGGAGCAFNSHVGGIKSAHHLAMQKWKDLRNPLNHIDKVADRLPPEKVRENRLRLNTIVESVRFLGSQALAFRGNDESMSSDNRGNFHEIQAAFGRNNPEVKRVLDNAPFNAKYSSPPIQKEILNIWANKVRYKIREEIGENKFCLLVDEASDSSHKEQMGIVLRFVDCKGFVRERFFALVNVVDTKSQTLKNEICVVLDKYNLLVENLRGQGYDGASNMRGSWNGLQALFLQECPYAYYVHCFAHRLQLALCAAAEEVKAIYRFFLMLSKIVNFVGGSTKRSTELKLTREAEIEELLDAELIETGKGANQTRSLQRPGTTRWGSHFRSVNSLIELFSSTKRLVDNLRENGHTRQICGDAEGIYLSMTSFEFVFVLHFMNKVMGITDFFCQKFQKKSIDIVSALSYIGTTKKLLQKLREDGWKNFLESVISFCETHEIKVPDMCAPYRVGNSARTCSDVITTEHHYRFDVFNEVIDKQLKELDDRFPEQSKELLTLSAALHPRDEFKSFKKDAICKLAEKFYPQDFTSVELHALDLQLTFYAEDIHSRPELQNIPSISELCVKLVETRLAEDYHLIHRLLCLVLTLLVSTASTERAFSAMRIIKNRLRNKIEEEFFDDCMLVHIERKFADSVDNESIMDEFATKTRRVELKIR